MPPRRRDTPEARVPLNPDKQVTAEAPCFIPRAGAARRARRLVASAFVLARPGIAAAVTVSGFAGMVLAARGLPPAGTAFLGLLSILMAASGSAVVNGLLDATMDALMRRVEGRVEALRTVGRPAALAGAAGLVAASLILSLRYLNPVAALLTLAAVLSYTVLYTLFFKRRSPYGTIPGGIPGALPVLIGYASVSPQIGADGIILFLLMILWQPPHFWSLALKYQDDYRVAGIPVLPVALGEPYTKALIFLYAVALLPMSLSLWALGYCSAGYAAVALLLGSGYLISCYRHVVASRRFGRAFAASILYLMALFLAIVVDVIRHGTAGV